MIQCGPSPRVENFGRVAYNLDKARRWIALGDHYEAGGQHDRADRAYRRSMEVPVGLIVHWEPDFISSVHRNLKSIVARQSPKPNVI